MCRCSFLGFPNFNPGMESDTVNARTLGVHRNACSADASYMASQEIKITSNKLY